MMLVISLRDWIEVFTIWKEIQWSSRCQNPCIDIKQSKSFEEPTISPNANHHFWLSLSLGLLFACVSSGEGEINRRKGLLATLNRQNDSLDDEVNNSSTRFGANRKAPSLADESAESQQYSNAQLLTQQRSALSAQDEKLDGILDGVTRLKVMSNDINQELDLHAGLLNELDTAVENTDARLQRNTKRVEIVTEQSGGCCGLITMALLFAVIIMLLVTNWGCKLPKANGSACS